MGLEELQDLKKVKPITHWRVRLAEWVESEPIGRFIVAIIILNAVILGLETNPEVMRQWGPALVAADKICLSIFVIELFLKGAAYQLRFWRSSWNVFDFLVVLVALAPGAGSLAVLRTLRVLRVLRLLTVVPSLRKVIAAFLHSIPGLAGVGAIMLIFFYTAGVLATRLFGQDFPDWFGSMGKSLYTLFQIMTLESWSMGIVRPVMEKFPFAWMFFVPFIVIATFTILNLFIGIIVSTMQELSTAPPPAKEGADKAPVELLEKIEKDLQLLRNALKK